jgi:DNA-binding XRE family transcriptional regulator
MQPSLIHKRLRERRKASGWTQLETARRVGITRQSLIHLESGRFVPSTTVALRLARVFGCQVEDLFSLSTPVTRLRAVLAPAFLPAVVHRKSEFKRSLMRRRNESPNRGWSEPARDRLVMTARRGWGPGLV